MSRCAESGTATQNTFDLAVPNCFATPPADDGPTGTLLGRGVGMRGRRVMAPAATLRAARSRALAQIPSSEWAGRERERFQRSGPVLAQPGGPAIKRPGSVAPPG